MSEWQGKSDFEINQAVADIYLTDYVLDNGKVIGFLKRDGVLNVRTIFNPCNNPSDAWPIIVESKITIDPSGCAWQHKPEPGDYHYDDGICNNFGCENPLRAAMIVFLEINGVKP